VRRRKAKQLQAVGEAEPSAAPGAARGRAPAGPAAQVARRGPRRRRRPKGPARQTRWMRVLGLLIATGGGVAIGFGWAGAAQVDCVECQIPFLLSGGAAGVGLIVFGVALMLLAQIRTESRRLGDRIEHALGLRPRPEDQQRPPAPAAQLATREQPATLPVAEPRGEDAAATAVTARPPAQDAALASSEPAPNPLSAVPVDSPAEGSDASRSDAATLSATTVAGGVVDSEGDGRESTAELLGEEERSAGVSLPAPQAEERPEDLVRRSDPERRGGLFRRRRGR
jgi:hypothetical protein